MLCLNYPFVLRITTTCNTIPIFRCRGNVWNNLGMWICQKSIGLFTNCVFGVKNQLKEYSFFIDLISICVIVSLEVRALEKANEHPSYIF